MNLLLISTADQQGGAAIACSRLLHGLRSEGVDAHLLVRDISSASPHIHPLNRPYLGFWKKARERWQIFRHNTFSRHNLWRVSTASTGFDLTEHPAFRSADVVHLHWVNQGLLSLHGFQKLLATGKPLVWTLHDMWPLTGICHHAYDCIRYQEACGCCPFLRHPKADDLSAQVHALKREAYGQSPLLSIVAVSTWLAQCAQRSSLLGNKPIQVIANALPVEDFQCLDRTHCRAALNIEPQKLVLLFGAARLDDPIKGFDQLKQALQLLVQAQPHLRSRLHLLLFGGVKDESLLHDLPIAHSHLGVVRGAAHLSQLYSAADLTLSASHYETFGQTLAESLACGCPVVAFDGSGTTDIVRHKVNGYLARHLDPHSLSQGIAWGLAQSPLFDREALRSDVVQRFSARHIAQQHLSLYHSLL